MMQNNRDTQMMPSLMLGTYQNNNYNELFNMVNTAVECGYTGFDTAPSYKTEDLLGKVIKECALSNGLSREDFFISDKIDAIQMQAGNGNIKPFIEDAISKMQVEYLDLLLIHWPVPEYIERTWDCMANLKESGLVKHIGMCNLRTRHLEKYSSMGAPIEYLQIERHPLRICSSEMDYCQENNIQVMAYSPMCQMDERLKNNEILADLSDNYSKSIGQIILRWHLDSGSTPVFMSRKSNRVKENLDIFDFNLKKEEIESINSLNINYKLFLESWGCLGF